MDNYKQNNGEQSNNKHWAVSSHSSSTLIISHYFWKETKKQTGWRDISHNSAELKTWSGSLKGSLPSLIVRETLAIFKKTDRWGNLSRWWYDLKWSDERMITMINVVPHWLLQLQLQVLIQCFAPLEPDNKGRFRSYTYHTHNTYYMYQRQLVRRTEINSSDIVNIIGDNWRLVGSLLFFHHITWHQTINIMQNIAFFTALPTLHIRAGLTRWFPCIFPVWRCRYRWSHSNTARPALSHSADQESVSQSVVVDQRSQEVAKIFQIFQTYRKYFELTENIQT